MIESPDKFEMGSVTVEANRGSADPVIYDITQIVAEINVFESLDLPYLTASFVVVDSAAMASIINFNGTEKIRVALSNNPDFPVEMEFFVHSVTNVVKSQSNDYTSTYVLNAIEPLGYISNFIKLRHGFSGNISSIITDIYSTHLQSEISAERAQQSVKVIIPNLSPLGACQWLKSRATSEFGEPMFLYSSIKEGPQMKSLGTLTSAEPTIPDPFLYAQYGNQNVRHKARSVMSLEIVENDNIIKIARSGAIKSKYFSIDPFKRTIDSVDFSAIDHFNNRSGRTLHSNKLFDSSFSIGNDNSFISDLDSTFFSQINTTEMYGPEFSSYDEERDFNEHSKKVSADSDRAFLSKQEINIIVPGWYMLSQASNTSIGTVIELIVPKDQPSIGDTSSEALVDKKKSGKWLIAKTRHKFNVTGSYVVAATLRRMASEDTLTDQESRPDIR